MIEPIQKNEFRIHIKNICNVLLTPDTLLNLRKKVKENGLDNEYLIVLKTSTKLDFTSSLVKALSDK